MRRLQIVMNAKLQDCNECKRMQNNNFRRSIIT